MLGCRIKGEERFGVGHIYIGDYNTVQGSILTKDSWYFTYRAASVYKQASLVKIKGKIICYSLILLWFSTNICFFFKHDNTLYNMKLLDYKCLDSEKRD